MTSDLGIAQLINVVASGLVAVSCGWFTWTYHRRAPWVTTPTGRRLMALVTVIGLLGTYTVLITFWPDGAIAAVLRIARTVVLLLIAALIMQLTQTVIRVQREPGNDPVAKD
ncbi:hypothetical protein [Streptomyces sp. NPDC050738]|uniref:putative phage holin n=1 Tax=Streptomyces sp. NPDC050738 TaxID=3154744 RepID=UPI0034242B44